jgi:hypothetical protein
VFSFSNISSMSVRILVGDKQLFKQKDFNHNFHLVFPSDKKSHKFKGIDKKMLNFSSYLCGDFMCVIVNLVYQSMIYTLPIYL